MNNRLFSKISLLVVVMICMLSSCASYKVTNKKYREYEGKNPHFAAPKYKIDKDRPPTQRYYNKGSLFRAKK